YAGEQLRPEAEHDEDRDQGREGEGVGDEEDQHPDPARDGLLPIRRAGGARAHAPVSSTAAGGGQSAAGRVWPRAGIMEGSREGSMPLTKHVMVTASGLPVVAQADTPMRLAFIRK